jgi:hypothetical protein
MQIDASAMLGRRIMDDRTDQSPTKLTQSQRVGESDTIHFVTLGTDPDEGSGELNEIRRQYPRRQPDQLGMMIPAGAHLLHASRKARACGSSVWEDGHAGRSDVDAWYVKKGYDPVDVAARKGLGVIA